MAEDAGRAAVERQRAAARGIAGRAGERLRNAVADDFVRHQRLRIRDTEQDDRGESAGDMDERSSQNYPP